MTETTPIRKLRLRWMSYKHNFGDDDPRTVTVAKALAEARAEQAQIEADQLRAMADAMPVPA